MCVCVDAFVVLRICVFVCNLVGGHVGVCVFSVVCVCVCVCVCGP